MIHIQFVTSAGCEHCGKTRELLDTLQKKYKLDVREIEMASEEGLELVTRYQIMLSPAVIINNELMSMGATSEEKLRKKLDNLKENSLV